ncbi:hypothetical protein Tco_1085744 [Tanacetum coccineum]
MRLSVGTKLQTGLNLGLYWRHPGPQILGLPRWGLVPHVSTFLGKTGSVGLEVLDTLGNSMTNLNANSGFILKKEILHSQGVQLLLSTDTKELLRIAAFDKREELEVFSQEVVRFGDMCKDLQWHNLDRLFARLDLEMVTSTHLREEAEITTQDLTNLAQYMSVLMDFPQLTMTLPDRSEESVMKRTTLVANTSNLWLLVRLQSIQMQMLLVHGQAGSEATDSGSCQSCAVPKGSLVAVFGEVGSGKSSLLNSVLVHGSDLVLLDDILSAVDAQVASWIISNEILSPLLWLQLLERNYAALSGWLSSDLYTIDDSLPFILNILLVMFNSSSLTNGVKLLRLQWRKIKKFSCQVGEVKNIFVKLFGDEKAGNTFWLDSSSTEKVYLLLLNYGYPYW